MHKQLFTLLSNVVDLYSLEEKKYPFSQNVVLNAENASDLKNNSVFEPCSSDAKAPNKIKCYMPLKHIGHSYSVDHIVNSRLLYNPGQATP